MRLALVGAGHAHLAVIAGARRLRDAGLEPVLIAPATFEYSGLAGAVLSGSVVQTAARIDIAALARTHGVEHRIGIVCSLDRAGRRLALSDGSEVPFDLVSFNIGSVVSDLATAAAGTWPVKPLTNLFDLRRVLERGAAGARAARLIIAGDGPTAFEIAASLLGLHTGRGLVPDVTLVGPDTAAGWAPSGAARHLLGRLEGRGLRRIQGLVVRHEEGEVQMDDGRRLACDHLVVATGLRAPRLTTTFDLPLDPVGRLRVTQFLQSLDEPTVFAAGDCATVENHPRPFAGVFGVRAGRVLLDNLCARAKGQPLRPYRPQRQWLSILDLGDGTGLAMHGRFWAAGRLVLAAKRRLDLGFIRRSRA